MDVSSRLRRPSIICNSSDLADAKKIATASDVIVLAALGHADKVRIIERLADGPAKQKELLADLGMSSPNASRWLGELTRANLISQDREGTHDPYWLVKRERTEELLDLAALLASELSDARVQRAEAQATADTKRVNARRERRHNDREHK